MLILYHARKEESGLPYPQKDTLMFNLPMGITHIILLYNNTSVKIYRTKKLNNGSRVTGSAI